MRYDESYIRRLISRVQWTWAKTYQSIPHEYIVRKRCGLNDKEFIYLVQAQREFGIPEQWHKYNFPYLYIDGYKYWTMGDPIEDTIIINRQKVFTEFDSLEHQEEDHNPQLMKQVVTLFNSAFAGREVYEGGCGEGSTIQYFGIPPHLYRGVDPSQKAIDTLKAAFPEYTGRVFSNSFEESVNYWSKSNAVILATFGAASYFMEPYLKILAGSGLDYFLMFYKEGYCPEDFQQMHHFNYQYYSLVELFPDAFFLPVENYNIVSSQPIFDSYRSKDAIPEAVLSEAFKHGVPADYITYLRETDRGSLYTDHVSPQTSDGLPLPTGCPVFFYYKDGKVEVEDLG